MINKVSVVRCFSYRQKEVDLSINKALKLINFNFKGIKRALIKPNIAWPAKPGLAITTHPAVIEALCKILMKENIEILIGESSIYDTKRAFDVSGIKKIAEKYGARQIVFETAQLITHNGIALPKIIKEVDLIINVPKLKTHALTQYTGAVKNVFGFVPGGRKSIFHKKYSNLDDFANFIVSLYAFINPNLTIMDGVVGMEGDGPSAGIQKNSSIILASRDGIALDRAECMILGLKNVCTNNVAIRKGLGKDFTIIGRKDLKIKFRKPSTLVGAALWLLPRSISESLGTHRVIIDRQNCIKCGQCKKHCPANAITEEYNIDLSKCILCYCCHEVCPNHAVKIKLDWRLLAFRQVRLFLSYLVKIKRRFLF